MRQRARFCLSLCAPACRIQKGIDCDRHTRTGMSRVRQDHDARPRRAENNSVHLDAARAIKDFGMPVRKVSVCARREKEKTVSGRPRIRTDEQKKICQENWENSHSKISIRLQRQQATQLRNIATAASLRTSQVVKKLLEFALTTLVEKREKRARLDPINAKIVRALRERGLGQREIGEILGCSQGHVCSLQRQAVFNGNGDGGSELQDAR